MREIASLGTKIEEVSKERKKEQFFFPIVEFKLFISYELKMILKGFTLNLYSECLSLSKGSGIRKSSLRC